MPIGILTDEEFELEINKVRAKIEEVRAPGRPPGKENTPETVRKVIAEESLNGATRTELSKTFAISESSVSAYRVGATSESTYNKSDKVLGAHVNLIKERIQKKARNRLVTALDYITSEKLAEAKLRDVASVAKDMSVVIRNMEPEKTIENTQQNNVQFVFFKPQLKQEADFDLVVVPE